MTFTVLARCESTGALGIGIASGSYGVPSRCPYVRSGVGAVSTQAHTNWRLGPLALDLLENGLAPAEVMAALAAVDPHFEYRQVGIVANDGRTAVHDGTKCMDYTGHRSEPGVVVMGNHLSGDAVIDAMLSGYQEPGISAFGDRLLRSLRAGLEAGGESPQGQSSASLTIVLPGLRRPSIDLRVDAGAQKNQDAILDLCEIYSAYSPLTDYYDELLISNPSVHWRAHLAERGVSVAHAAAHGRPD